MTFSPMARHASTTIPPPVLRLTKTPSEGLTMTTDQLRERVARIIEPFVWEGSEHEPPAYRDGYRRESLAKAEAVIALLSPSPRGDEGGSYRGVEGAPVSEGRPTPEEELRAYHEAWHEMSCCDDISLSGSLAAAIGELQSDREYLRSALAAKAPVSGSGLTPPAGWRLVPEEPTFEMVSRGGHAIWDHASPEKHQLMEAAYRAMLAAAPASPAPPADPWATTLTSLLTGRTHIDQTDCRHERLGFASGGFYVQCYDCSTMWARPHDGKWCEALTMADVRLSREAAGVSPPLSDTGADATQRYDPPLPGPAGTGLDRAGEG